jgi:hypothetical protein
MVHQLTNYREVLAYSVAHGIRIAAVYLLAYLGVLAPLYKWAYRTGGSLAVLPVSFVLSLFWITLALPLFLMARGLFGGVPPMVAGPGQEEAITSTAAEIGAYFAAHLIGIVALMLVNSLILSAVYAALYQSGHRGFALPLGAALSVIATAAVFLIFVGLRRAFSAAPEPGRV